MAQNLLNESEPLFMERYPTRFPSGTFGGSPPSFIAKNGWAKGTPWNNPKTRIKDDTSFRKVFQITMDDKDEERMTAIPQPPHRTLAVPMIL